MLKCAGSDARRSKRLVYSLGYEDVKTFYDLPLDQQEKRRSKGSSSSSTKRKGSAQTDAERPKKKKCTPVENAVKRTPTADKRRGVDDCENGSTSGSNDERGSDEEKEEGDGEDQEDLLGAVRQLKDSSSISKNGKPGGDYADDDPCYEDMTRDELVRHVKGYKKLSRRKDKELAKADAEMKEMEVCFFKYGA